MRPVWVTAGQGHMCTACVQFALDQHVQTPSMQHAIREMLYWGCTAASPASLELKVMTD